MLVVLQSTLKVKIPLSLVLSSMTITVKMVLSIWWVMIVKSEIPISITTMQHLLVLVFTSKEIMQESQILLSLITLLMTVVVYLL